VTCDLVEVNKSPIVYVAIVVTFLCNHHDC